MTKKILIITDNLPDQINGVVTTYKNISVILILAILLLGCGGAKDTLHYTLINTNARDIPKDTLDYTLINTNTRGILVNSNGTEVSSYTRTLVAPSIGSVLWEPTLEFFTWNNTWIYLDYFQNIHTKEKYIQRVTEQTYCKNNQCVTDPNPSLQWYAPRYITDNFILDARGTITGPSGIVVNFRHSQTWTTNLICNTPYYSSIDCIRQTEQWWDDNGSAYQQRIDRDTYYGKALGIGLIIRDRMPSPYTLYLK